MKEYLFHQLGRFNMLSLPSYHSPKGKQKGLALIVLMILLAMATSATIYSRFNIIQTSIERDKKTSVALQRAKEALIYYSLNNAYLTSPACISSTNCPRPGDLPCPDRTNDGSSDSCNNSARRLNRLPWRTLGLEELTDGYGERLWYAVSNNYKSNTRSRPLNSDTVGTITVRDASGKVLYDATSGGGVVAVIISTGAAINRQDGYVQNRDAVGINTAANYLDIAQGEDNANFSDNNANGFIIGPVKDGAGNIISNDRLIVITRDEMAAAMEFFVLTQVRAALLSFYTTNAYYPYPAAFNDVTCLVNTSTNITSGCNSVDKNYAGRIPVSNLDLSSSTWEPTSILKGSRAGNWFQQNLWRELIYYSIAPDCEVLTPNCSGFTQKLTLNNALTLPLNGKHVVILSAGKIISAQNRASKIAESNYLEDENALPLDYVFSRSTTISNLFNDRAISIP